jgi:hypothetical protein
MSMYGNPGTQGAWLSLTVLAGLGALGLLARGSTLRFYPNPVPERPRNCTSCVDVGSSQNQACQTCVGPGYPNYRPRLEGV